MTSGGGRAAGRTRVSRLSRVSPALANPESQSWSHAWSETLGKQSPSIQADSHSSLQEGGISDTLSACSIRIVTFFQQTRLGQATGFIYQSQDTFFLITNWHVVSGRDPSNGKPLHPQCAVPDRILCCPPTSVGNPERFEVSYTPQELLLCDGDRPLWLEHPVHGHRVDVVAIRLRHDDSAPYWTINDCMKAYAKFKPFALRPGFDGFIIGFPFDTAIAAHLPIWKRCTIASEPDFPFAGFPSILVDTSTRSGMSGAPVIAQLSGMFANEDYVFATKRQFVGVYSGRLGQGQFEAQLGIVWASYLIDEILAPRKAFAEAPGKSTRTLRSADIGDIASCHPASAPARPSRRPRDPGT